MEGIYLSPDMFNPETVKNVFSFDEIIGTIDTSKGDFLATPHNKKAQAFNHEAGAINYIKNLAEKRVISTAKVNPAQCSLF